MNHHLDASLAYEQAVNERYLSRLAQRVTRDRRTASVRGREDWAPLTARVMLSDGEQFYLGPSYVPNLTNGVSCFSWAAPVAAVHFEDLPSWDGRGVERRRIFTGRLAQIGRVLEEAATSDARTFPDRSNQRPASPPVENEDFNTWMLRMRSGAAVKAPLQPTPPPDLLPLSGGTTSPSRRDLAMDLMRQPRREAMTSLLATLAPPQYRVVTARPDIPLIVQGQPGTGKTVVVAHRAAWLLNEDNGQRPRLRSVLVTGPSADWARHVSPAIKELHAEGVTVRPLPLILFNLASGKAAARVTPTDPLGQLSVLADLVDAIVMAMRQSPRSVTGEAVYTAVKEANITQLVHILPALSSVVDETEFQRWREQLPTWQDVVRRPSAWALAAYIELVVGDARPQFDHIVVDEAQDVSELEWRILRRLSRGGWTLVGDMNQRRNFSGNSTWEPIIALVGAGEWAEHQLVDGFRTTQQIIDFANAILPKSRRVARRSLLEGDTPRLIKNGSLAGTLEHNALELAAADARSLPGDSTVAIIAPHALARSIQLRAERSGWTKDRNLRLVRDGLEVLLRSHDDARGLEFDAVVVVEPVDFPKSLQNGPLYTALTRANKRLTVLYSKELSDNLRDGWRTYLRADT